MINRKLKRTAFVWNVNLQFVNVFTVPLKQLNVSFLDFCMFIKKKKKRKLILSPNFWTIVYMIREFYNECALGSTFSENCPFSYNKWVLKIHSTIADVSIPVGLISQRTPKIADEKVANMLCNFFTKVAWGHRDWNFTEYICGTHISNKPTWIGILAVSTDLPRQRFGHSEHLILAYNEQTCFIIKIIWFRLDKIY